jgi:very-long-chain (3R)-3-hydroxyacyl-CoA dehydratase
VWMPTLLMTWAVSEVIRYPYYLAAVTKKPPQLLEWLRYSAFIILYPM